MKAIITRQEEGCRVELTQIGKYLMHKKIGAGEDQFKDNTIFIEGPIPKGQREPLESRVIAIGHNDISSGHLGIFLDNDSLTLYDSRSRHGSMLNGKKFKFKEIKETGEYWLRLGETLFGLEVI